VKELQSPEQQRAANEVKVEEKLLLDQPDIITEAGKVEHVVKDPGTEAPRAAKSQGTSNNRTCFLTKPLDDGFVIVQ
jgi:hypothetical protein